MSLESMSYNATDAHSTAFYFRFQPSLYGDYILSVRLSGERIAGSPFGFVVGPARAVEVADASFSQLGDTITRFRKRQAAVEGSRLRSFQSDLVPAIERSISDLETAMHSWSDQPAQFEGEWRRVQGASLTDLISDYRARTRQIEGSQLTAAVELG